MRTASVLLTAALLAISTPLAAIETPTAAAEMTLPAITVSPIEVRHLRDIVLATGLVSPRDQIQVAPLIEGQPIEALLADIGDKVTAGQVLARLSTSTLELQKAQLKASLESAKAQIAQSEAQMIDAKSAAAEAQRVADRTAALRKQGAASQAALDQTAAAAVSASVRVSVATQTAEAARAQRALVEAQMANVDLQLSRTEVKAPFGGEITARNAQLGAIASAQGQPMFTLIRDGALELRADISETDLGRIAIGQKVALTLVGSATPVTGTVRLIEPVIDPATRLGRARITFDDSSTIRSGMYAEAEILVKEADVPAVPITAIGASKGENTVMLVTNGIASLQIVTTGIRDGGWVEIAKGATAGQTVVTKAGAFVRDGDHINPIAAKAATTN